MAFRKSRPNAVIMPSSRKSSCEMRNSGAGRVNSSEGEVAMDTVPSATTKPVARPTSHGTTIGEDRRTFLGRGPRRVELGAGLFAPASMTRGAAMMQASYTARGTSKSPRFNR